MKCSEKEHTNINLTGKILKTIVITNDFMRFVNNGFRFDLNKIALLQIIDHFNSWMHLNIASISRISTKEEPEIESSLYAQYRSYLFSEIKSFYIIFSELEPKIKNEAYYEKYLLFMDNISKLMNLELVYKTVPSLYLGDLEGEHFYNSLQLFRKGKEASQEVVGDDLDPKRALPRAVSS